MATGNSLNLTSTSPLPMASGGTSGNLTASNGGVVYSSASGMVVLAGTATANQVLLSGSNTAPSWGAAPPISIVNISGTTQVAAANNGYVVGNAAQTTITLPATAALGSVVEVIGKGAAGWILAPGAAQTINVGSASASVSVSSANQYDCIRVVCVTANTTWVMTSSVTSGFTIL